MARLSFSVMTSSRLAPRMTLSRAASRSAASTACLSSRVRQQGGLVHQVRQVGAAHPHRAPRDLVEIDIGGQGDVARVDLEDLEPAFLGGQVDGDVAVEPAGAEQGGVEDVGAIGRGQDDHALAGREPVHLGEDLVERLLALVMSAAQPGTSDPAHGVDLVDEQDAGAVLLGGLEHVANTAGTHAHEHLDELGARDRVERHARLSGHRPAQQRLARAGGTDQEHALGNPAAQPLELLGVLEELDDLLELALGVLEAGDFLERGPLLRLVVPLGRALDEAAQDAAVKLVARPPHHQVDKPRIRNVGRSSISQTRPLAELAGLVSIRTGSLVLLLFRSFWITGSIDCSEGK